MQLPQLLADAPDPRFIADAAGFLERPIDAGQVQLDAAGEPEHGSTVIGPQDARCLICDTGRRLVTGQSSLAASGGLIAQHDGELGLWIFRARTITARSRSGEPAGQRPHPRDRSAGG